MKQTKIIVGLCVAVLLLLFGSFIFVFHNLNVGEEPEEVDVIVVPEGGLDVRATKAVDLMKDGYADKIIVSLRVVTASSDTADAYRDAGASEEELIYEYDSTSTWTNAENSLAIMEERGYESALVVTTHYHTRRTKLSFERVNNKEDYGFDLTYIAADPIEDSRQDIELSALEKRRIKLRETIKYFGYLLGLYHWIDL